MTKSLLLYRESGGKNSLTKFFFSFCEPKEKQINNNTVQLGEVDNEDSHYPELPFNFVLSPSDVSTSAK